ncbi:MAG: shikimate dehydrogenase [Nitrospirae bacterium]|nr:shikimate dehydrogenase [Nitrospirota bacterium]
MDVSGKTKILGLLGFPVEHTLSPAMHNAAFKVMKLDMCYLPFKVLPEELPQAVKAVRVLNLTGVNVTVPHKEKVVSLLDEVDKEALFISAVNTIVNKDGKLIGYNTDGRGFMKSLSEAGIYVRGKKILIIGAGGASRAISYYLSEKAGKLFLFDIDKKKAEKLVRDLRKIRKNIFFFSYQPSAISHQLDEFDIIINATPLGFKKGDPMPINLSNLNKKHIVCDLVYKKTVFLGKASQKGCKTLNGLGMLLWQGVFAFELWTGKKPPVEVMRKALESGLAKAG